LEGNSEKTRKKAGTKFIEKYLQISDVLNHILDNTDMFIEHQLSTVTTRAEERKVLHDFLLRFLLAVQDVINYDLTVEILIENEVLSVLLEALYVQTDAAMRQSVTDDELSSATVSRKKGAQGRRARVKHLRKKGTIFSRANRIQLLVAVFN
jgi:hypothetical protein